MTCLGTVYLHFLQANDDDRIACRDTGKLTKRGAYICIVQMGAARGSRMSYELGWSTGLRRHKVSTCS